MHDNVFDLKSVSNSFLFVYAKTAMLLLLSYKRMHIFVYSLLHLFFTDVIVIDHRL